ncbi:MAG: pyridoxal phosphate-dependent aminotransferase [Prevotellaceae bacterium]|jgi:cystathionine beta-lyase|nr:pyridoxal phosphate-dependent aminotransferase [Prevotellaceae bacterium]
MIYNFDELTNRRNTNCEKWDNCAERFGRNDLLPLWVADMDFKTPDFIINALKQRLEHEVLGYPIRPRSFYDAVKNWLQQRGWQIDTDKISFSPGVVPAINFAVNVFTNPGDRILINTPVYHPFMYAVNNHGRTLVKSSLVNSGGYYTVDFDDFEKKLASGVKMFIMCSPHNPVGRVWTVDELKKTGELCLKYNVLIISDEIHSDLIFKPHKHTYFASISKEFASQTVTFIAPSKTFNIAGLSSSIIYSDNAVLHEKISRYLKHLSISAGTVFGDVALEAAYTYGGSWLNQLLEYLDGNCEYVVDYLKKHIPQIRTVKPEGTYLMWLDCRELNMTSSQIQEFMVSKAGLALNPGCIFGDEGELFVRMNIATQRTILVKAMDNLRKAMEQK